MFLRHIILLARDIAAATDFGQLRRFLCRSACMILRHDASFRATD